MWRTKGSQEEGEYDPKEEGCCGCGGGPDGRCAAGGGLWWYSPGPEWLARRTAESYAEQYAPEYSYQGWNMGVGRPGNGFWIVTMFREEDMEQKGPALHLEISGAMFPTQVIVADWWAPEEMDWPDIELPVPG